MRFYEIIPGLASWLTLLSLIFLSWKYPVFVVFFILLYDLYWILKLFYLFSHLRFSFLKMRKYLGIDWLQKIKSEKLNFEDIYHLIILPFYKEPKDVVEESLNSLLLANYPQEKFFVVLASEERGGEKDWEMALEMEAKFKNKFGSFLVTKHPANIEGELPGKGSNEAFAAKMAIPHIIDKKGIPYEKVLVSVFDIDTKVEKDYFGVLTYHFLKTEKPLRSSYQPIPIFLNNFSKTKFFSRLISFSATFWQLMQSSRPEQLVTFSSHSLPLKALVDIGFWETNLVSEDSRIFFQCLNYYNGDWRTVPLFYPIYMNAVEGNFLSAVKNLYKQQRRWAWGAENFAYLLRDFKKNKLMPLRKKIFWIFTMFDGFYSWATSSFIIFIFGVLPNILGNEEFKASLISYNLPRYTGVMLNLSTIGIMISAVLTLVIISHKVREVKKTRYFFYFIEWLLMPLTFIIFGALPALDAQTRLMIGGKFRLGYWRTPKKG